MKGRIHVNVCCKVIQIHCILIYSSYYLTICIFGILLLEIAVVLDIRDIERPSNLRMMARFKHHKGEHLRMTAT